MHGYVHADDLILNTLLWYVVQKSARRSFLIGGNCLVLGCRDQKDDPEDGPELGFQGKCHVHCTTGATLYY